MHMMAAGIPGQMAHYGGMSLPMGVEAGHEHSNLPHADPRHAAKQHNTLTQTMDKDFTVLSYRGTCCTCTVMCVYDVCAVVIGESFVAETFS